MADPDIQTRSCGLASRWNLIKVAYVLFVLLAGTNLPTPLYHGYEQAFGHTPFVTTLIFAVYVATLIPALLIVGPMADAYDLGMPEHAAWCHRWPVWGSSAAAPPAKRTSAAGRNCTRIT